MTTFQDIDTALGEYYQQFGDYNYFDNEGIGKFLRFCTEESFDPNDIDEELADDNEDNCGYLDFDPLFPFKTDVHKNESEKRSEIFRILKHCHAYNHPPAINIDSIRLNQNRAQRFMLHATFSHSVEPNDPNILEKTEHKHEAEPQEATLILNDLQKLCKGLGIYYRCMKRVDYYDKNGVGQFTKWFESEEMDINDMKEEFMDSANCAYLDFDRDADTKTNHFPLAPNIVKEDERLQKQFKIMLNIYKDGHFAIADAIYHHKGFDVNFGIEEEEKQDAIAFYKAQCPRLFECFENEPDLMYLLAISYWNNIPFALWMVDCYARDRLKHYLTNGKQLSVSEWTFDEISKYVDDLAMRYTANKKHDIVNKIQHGIKAYICRILPQFKFDTFCTIKDDIFQIVNYIEAASQFIMKVIHESEQTHAPFQWDFCIAVRDVTDKKGNIVIPFAADEDDDDCDAFEYDSTESEDNDIIGDIEKKLKSNKCPYYVKEITTRSNHGKNHLLIRPFWTSYEKFRDKYDIQTFNAQNMFPRMRRFCTLIDRRKYVTTTEEKRCEANKSTNCGFHKELDRNCDGIKKDDIYHWIPPKNCDSLPTDKNGYVCEVFLDNLNKCIIPRIGYIDSIDSKNHFKIEDAFAVNKAIRCRALTSTITSKNNCNERLLIFSFHVESEDEIRCYLWWKGACLRFMPRDIIQVLPLMFDKQYKNNDKFTQNQNIEEQVQNMKFSDQLFNQWRHKITNQPI